MSKVLFILKRREDYNAKTHAHAGLSTGLYNSASFVNDMLTDSGIESVLEVAIDNNCIDRLVNLHKPTHVIIEALWVVPSKFAILTKLHPNVKWIIRLHSEMPFMAGEGMAMDWLGDYMTYPQLYLAVNAPRMLEETKEYLKTVFHWRKGEENDRVIYLPNYYPKGYKRKEFHRDKYWVDVACFGAIRPLKNHLVQAHAAVKFANMHHKQLRFHVNSGRVEMQGQPAINNLVGMFQQLNKYGHQLVSHEWRPREDFLALCSGMDIGLQCNFSETFNIVSADLISQGVPIVGSDEIPWSSCIFNAKASYSDSIARKMGLTYAFPNLNVLIHQKKLNNYTNSTIKVWSNYFNGV